MSWLGEAWQMFKEAPGSWVACFLIFIIIMIVLAVIPVLGNIAGALISPFLIAGMKPLLFAARLSKSCA